MLWRSTYSEAPACLPAPILMARPGVLLHQGLVDTEGQLHSSDRAEKEKLAIQPPPLAAVAPPEGTLEKLLSFWEVLSSSSS